MERIYNLEQLREKLGISVRTLREYIKKKELKASKIGRAFFVSENNLSVFFKDREAYSWRKKGDYPFDDLS
jgi:hypothetical protein